MVYRLTASFSLLLLLTVVLSANEPVRGLLRVQKTAGAPAATIMNINEITAWYETNGTMENNPFTGNSGLLYPRGTSAAVFTSGVLWGGYVNDGVMAVDQPRVNGTAYNSGISPGRILGNRTGVTEPPDAPDVRLWRIRRDYVTANLHEDAALLMNKLPQEVTENDIAAVRLQYRTDWAEWPAAKGAPFYDADQDGMYTPQFIVKGGVEMPVLYPFADEPGCAKGDQVLWYVANDIQPGDSPWKSKSIGLEVQFTIWGYANDPLLRHSLYKKVKLIYKGTAITPDTAAIRNMYITHWSDPDLGDAGDDFSGCDTLYDLAYVYNAQLKDREYSKFMNTVPAIGFSLVQGPVIPAPGDTASVDFKRRPGFRNLPMTSSLYFAAGGDYSDPPFLMIGSSQWYSMMMGLPPTPQPPPFPTPLNDPVSGLPTRYWLSGNPLTKVGWVDGVTNSSGDRRILFSSGPFTMALGDTQVVVFAVSGGTGSDQLMSIAALKKNSENARQLYRSSFSLQPPVFSVSKTDGPTIHVRAKSVPGTFAGMKAQLKTFNGSVHVTLPMIDDGMHGDSVAQDGIWGSDSITLSLLSSLTVSAVLTTPDQKNFIIERVVEPLTTIGEVELVKTQIVYDQFNGDGVVNPGEYFRYSFSVHNTTQFPLNTIRIIPSVSDQFGVGWQLPHVPAGKEFRLLYNKYDQNTFFSLVAPMSAASVNVDFDIYDSYENHWKKRIQMSVVPGAVVRDTVPSVAGNVIGKSDAQIDLVLYNPAIVGKEYELWFGQGYWNAVERTSGGYSPLRVALRQPYDESNKVWGEGRFRLSADQRSIAYEIDANGLTFPIKALSLTVGDTVRSLPFTGTVSSGVLTFFDPLAPLNEKRLSLFRQGQFRVYVYSDDIVNWVGGQVDEGLTEKRVLPEAGYDFNALANATENRLDGFSLYVAPPPLGYKSVQQVQPTAGPVLGIPDPNGKYSILPSESNFDARSRDGKTVEIRFTGQMGWALCYLDSNTATPVSTYFMKVPFSAYHDTARVFPVIYDANHDTVWNTTSNARVNGKPLFDRIVGVAAGRDWTGSNLGYYVNMINGTPPTSNTFKGKIMNGGNRCLGSVVFVNEASDSVPPAASTVIRFTPFYQLFAGDVKSVTLRRTGVVEQSDAVPQEYFLSQNFPNPFNPYTRIEYSLPRHTRAILTIYDVIGREVATIVNEIQQAGRHTVDWNGRNTLGQPMASGVYFCRFRADGFTQSRKMMLIK